VIVFGFRGRVATLGTGRFYCPRCRGDRSYTRKGVRRWFTLFFVPVFPISATTGTRVCCDTCGGAFSEEVLAQPTAEAFRTVYGTAFRSCALEVLRAGDPTNALARTSALAAINDLLPSEQLDDAALDRDLTNAVPTPLAVALAPVVNRLDAGQAEWFFGACAKVALADGPLSERERRALETIGESLHLTAAHQVGVIETLRAPVEPTFGEG
jgi:hypothetical protein